MPVARIPLVVTLSAADSARMLSKDQFMKNCVIDADRNPLSREARYWIRGRGTFQSVYGTANGAGVATAINAWSGMGASYFAVARNVSDVSLDSVLSVYNGSSFSNLGTITGEGAINFISETTISDVPALFFHNGNCAWYYVNGGSLTQVTDSDFPTELGSPLTLTGKSAHLNGRCYVMTTSGRIYGSDINSLSSFDPQNYISASRKPDAGIGIARYKDRIVAFGDLSIEFFTDQGNSSGSQLSRTTDGIIDVGCVNQFSYTEFNDTIAFIGRSASLGFGVYVLDGGSAQKISTPAVDNYLNYKWTANNSAAYGFKLYVIRDNGKNILVVSVAGTLAIVFDADSAMWGWWTFNTNAAIVQTTPWRYTTLMAVDNTSDPIGTVTNTLIQGTTVQTFPNDFGIRTRKTIKRVTIVTDSIANLNDGSDSATLVMHYGDYDSTVTKTISLESARPSAYRCGSGYAVAFTLTMPSGIVGSGLFLPRASALEVEYTVGAA